MRSQISFTRSIVFVGLLLLLTLPQAVRGMHNAVIPVFGGLPVQAQGPEFVYLPIIFPNRASVRQKVVFVSRQIPSNGSIYWNVPNDMPGVGTRSRFRVAAPGKLMVRAANGVLTTLINGANPTPASLNLIDVNAPDVSYDGQKIVFAGLPAGNYSTTAGVHPGAWRLYTINVNGSGLQQLTFSDQNLNLTAASLPNTLSGYDDTDPVWLPDGRIAFSSTRWPSFAQYSGARATNLYVVNADNTNLHRITAERNGADRPVVDPLTGKIVFARWWRNHRFALDSMDTIPDPDGGYQQHLGLTTNRSNHVGGAENLWRNSWHLATINPDGTGLEQWGGTHHKSDTNHAYGGTFMPDGSIMANYFPMHNMTEASGFGGIRHYQRGPGMYEPILGVTQLTLDHVHAANPTSYGIYTGNYAAEPVVMPDGRLIVSWAEDIGQDYGLYTVNADGTELTLLYDNPGTSELQAQIVGLRPLPPIINDSVVQVPSLLPPPANGPYDQDGTFVFDALNIYANAPVDTEILSAPAVGSGAIIRFFIDHQRVSSGSFPNLDWPILLGEKTIHPDGSVREPNAPANVPLFEQLRSANGTVPETGGPDPDGAGHVAGMNFGRPGTVARCMGCHAGHTMIPVPATAQEAQWSNLAPGAEVTVSSARDAEYIKGVIDRQVLKGEIWRYWNSHQSQNPDGQWVQLTFPVPVTVRTVRLYNPRQGDEANSTLQVHNATVRLYSDAAATIEVGKKTVNKNLSVSGTDVQFDDVLARTVRVEINDISGTFYGFNVASLAEIEVIARGEAAP